MSSANLLAANLFLRNGVRVYGYPGMSHVKAAIFDGWACIGSANFNKLSAAPQPRDATSPPRTRASSGALLPRAVRASTPPVSRTSSTAPVADRRSGDRLAEWVMWAAYHSPRCREAT